jgi:hypothetical protein
MALHAITIDGQRIYYRLAGAGPLLLLRRGST